MIYDCFIFNNELDMLDIRLNILDSLVDKFVLVESTVTHTNKNKPLYYQLNRKRYEKFHDKIIHIVVSDTPDVNLPWIINDFQFSQIARGLKNCKPEDIILFGDADEIPDPSMVKEWKDKPGKHKLFIQKLSYFYLNLVANNFKPNNGTHMFNYKNLLSYKSLWIAKFSKPDVEILNGGWHFSYMSDWKGIQNKIESMAHQEFNNSKFNTPENIKMSMLNGTDLFNLGVQFKVEDINTLPAYIRNNLYKYKQYIIFDKIPTKGVKYSLTLINLRFKQHLRLLKEIIKKIQINNNG